MLYRDDPQVQTMIANLPEKTGKPLDEWFKVLDTSGLTKHGEMMKLLKGEYGMTHGFANMVCLMYRQESAATPPPGADDLVENQYAKKQDLKPIYDQLLAAALAFGPDVEVAPKKNSVSLRRARQFVLIQPTTKTRVDLGIQLKEQEPEGKLESGEMWNGMCSHRIQLSSPADIDDEVLDWMRQAYEAAG
jgi:predicted transport protein